MKRFQHLFYNFGNCITSYKSCLEKEKVEYAEEILYFVAKDKYVEVEDGYYLTMGEVHDNDVLIIGIFRDEALKDLIYISIGIRNKDYACEFLDVFEEECIDVNWGETDVYEPELPLVCDALFPDDDFKLIDYFWMYEMVEYLVWQIWK